MKFLLFALLLLPAFAESQTIAQKADELLTAYALQQKFSGSVLIAKRGKIIFEKGYGYADLKTRQKNTATTEFRVGSLTKMFTSTLILQLVSESKLSLSDPVTKYVPGFSDGDKIQLLHLLSHTSGIHGITEAPTPTNLEESVMRFRTDTLAFEPGSRFEYNNFNYILLSYIAQKVTGVPFATLLKEKVLNHVGMYRSGLDTKVCNSMLKAKGYVTNPETVQWQVAGGDGADVALASGAGALYSSVSDLYKWALALSSHTVLSDSTLAKAMTPIQNGYGLGWMTSNRKGKASIGHTGSIPGFLANFMRFEQEDITIIWCANYQDTDGNRLSDDLTAIVFGDVYSLPVKKKAVVLPQTTLRQLVGNYQLPNGFEISVTAEGTKLFALAKGDTQKIELTAESNRKFYLKGPETEIQFLEEAGVVKYMFVDMQGGQKFTKVN